MAEDIVTRLRSGIFRTVDNREAADEIERLRALTNELQEALREAATFCSLPTTSEAQARRAGQMFHRITLLLAKCQEGSE